MIKILLQSVLALSIVCLAQTSFSIAPESSSAADSQIWCPNIETHGMQKTQNVPSRPDKDKWKFNKINIEGVVDSVGVDTFFVENEYVVYYNNTPNVGKIIKIKDVILEGPDNNMKLIFDSNVVFVPLELNISKGDSVFITNYSATFFLECYTHTNLHGEFMGEFFVNSRPTTIIPYKPRQAKVPTVKKSNRNAAGKFLKDTPSKIIKY